MTITNRAGSARAPLSGAYRTVWRWHFYAGLLVLPVLCLMALTGGLYLFKDEIDAAVYRPYERIEAGGQWASPDRWTAGPPPRRLAPAGGLSMCGFRIARTAPCA